MKGTREQRENNVGGITGKGFVPGKSGNPNGRPKGSVGITKHLREALEANDQQKAHELVEALIEQAMRGNGTAIKVIWDRIDGKVGKVHNEQGIRTIHVVFGDDPSSPGTHQGG